MELDYSYYTADWRKMQMKSRNNRVVQDDANGVVIDCRSGVEQMEDVQRYRKQSVPKVLIRNRRKHFVPKGKVVGH